MSARQHRGSVRAGLLGALVGAVLAWVVGMYASGRFQEREDETARPIAHAATVVPANTPEVHALAQRLKQGGFIFYFRHAQRQKWDSVMAFDVFETAQGIDATRQSYYDAVCLTPQGKEEGKMIGAIMAYANVPIGRVESSPSCRARQTAQFAFGRIDKMNIAFVHTPVTNATNAPRFEQALREALTHIPIAEGTNTVVVAHGNTLNNNPKIFKAGHEFLGEPLQETGFYVIARDADGALRIVHKFVNLGEFASNAVDLDPGVTPAMDQ